MKIKTRQKRKLELFNPVKIRLLKRLSDIEPSYLDYPEGTNDEGFLVNMTSEELGLEALIAQKWIIHSS